MILATLAATLTALKRDDLPLATTSESKSTANLPAVSTSKGLPTISTSSVPTPSMFVPTSNENPYVSKTHLPHGTVFIAVGSVVAAILVVFALYHIFKRIHASILAKRATKSEKGHYRQYLDNNFAAYGGARPQLMFMTEYQGSVAKLPLLLQTASNFGGSQADTLTIYDGPTAHNDLTRMFVSPTGELMHARNQLQTLPSELNLYGKAGGSPAPATNRHSQLIPNLIISESNSESGNASTDGEERRNRRSALPSMYLEDLIQK